MPAKQNIYKDLSGDRKAKLQDFVFNPKAEDPTGAERTPQELYTNTADNQLKYFDDNLDLRYAVPGVVKAIAPTELDINYDLGTEWKLEDSSAVFKLLNIDEFGKAQWRELPELEPLILLDKNIILYCDSNTGNDSNEGTDAEPFETIPGAIAKINSTYDFNNGKYRYVLRVRGEHILDSFVFNAPTGATSQNFYLDGYSPDAKISSTSNYVISLKTSIQLFVRDLEFTSTSLSNCFLVSDGRLIVSGCKFSGKIDNIFNLSAFGRLRTLDNTIENLTAQSLVKCTHRSDYFQTGDFKAIGTNSIDTVLYLANSTIAYITPTATFTLDNGATVMGSPFIKFGNSSLRLSDIDQFSVWGDIPGEWYGAGLYRS